MNDLANSSWLIVAGSFASIIALLLYLSDKFGDPNSAYHKFAAGVLKFKIPIIIAIVLVFLSFLITYISMKTSKIEKVKIGLIVPLRSTIDVQMDAERQIQGLATLITKKPEVSQKFQFSIFEGDMNPDTVTSIIKKELNNGTKFFVVTMSKIALHISKNWDSIFSDIPLADQPIIIATVASSPEIKMIKNRFYRFYIRSNEEGQILAKKANLLDINKITYIVVDDSYGKGAVESFKDEWESYTQRRFEDGIYVENASDKEKIKNQILKKKNVFLESDGIFIAHYGSGIDNIVTCLFDLKICKTIIATSTITIPVWFKPVESILKKTKWISCIPAVTDSYKVGGFIRTGLESSNTYKGDVVNDFTYYTLDRLINAIELTKSNNLSFDEAWSSNKNEEPEGIKYKIDGTSGDSKITLESITDTIYYMCRK